MPALPRTPAAPNALIALIALIAGALLLALPAARADDAAAESAFKQRCAKCHSLDEAVVETRKSAHGKDAGQLAQQLRKHHARNDAQAKTIADYLVRLAGRPG
jgi:mono/diheme cytochrome c family protein